MGKNSYSLTLSSLRRDFLRKLFLNLSRSEQERYERREQEIIQDGGWKARRLSAFRQARRAPSPYDLNAFAETLKLAHPTSILEALKLIPASEKFRLNLINEQGPTGGLQPVDGASGSFRILSSGVLGTFVSTFSDPPSQEASFAQSQDIEIASYDDHRDAWERARVVIEKDAAGNPRAVLERQAALDVHHSCIGCHGVDHNLRWGPYAHWKRAIGSDDDYLFPGGLESNELNRFLTQRSHQGLYAALPIRPGQFNTARESSIGYINLRNDAAPVRGGYQYRSDPRDLTDRMIESPNTAFGATATYHSAWRLVRLVKTSLPYSQYKYAIEGAMLECPDLEDFLPPETRRLHRLRYSDLANHMRELEKPYLADIPERDPYARSGVAVTGLRYLFEGRGIGDRLGIQRWFIGADEYPYADSGGEQPSVKLAREILETLEPDLLSDQLPSIWNLFTEPRPECEDLRQKSLHAFTK